MTNLQKEIQEAVFKRLAGGSIHMRSRIYFVAQIALTASMALVALLVSAFVLSFILFSMHEGGEQFLLGAGGRGIVTFLALFPWLLLAFDVVVIVLLEWLLQGLKLGYRFSLLSVFLAVFGASAVLALLITLTPIHRILLDRAEGDELPVFGDLYKGVYYSHENQGVFKGVVTSVQGNVLDVVCEDRDHDADEGAWKVVLPDGITQLFSVGEHIYIFGQASANRVIEANQVEELSPR